MGDELDDAMVPPLNDPFDDLFDDMDAGFVEPRRRPTSRPVNDTSKLVLVKFEQLVNQTEKAWILRLYGNRTEVFPKSQCKISIELGVIGMPQWIQKSKKVFGLVDNPDDPY